MVSRGMMMQLSSTFREEVAFACIAVKEMLGFSMLSIGLDVLESAFARNATRMCPR